MISSAMFCTIPIVPAKRKKSKFSHNFRAKGAKSVDNATKKRGLHYLKTPFYKLSCANSRKAQPLHRKKGFLGA